MALLTTAPLLADEKKESSNSVGVIEKVNFFLKNNESEKALEKLNEVLATDSQNARALRLRGNIYFSIENYLKALQDFDCLVALHPKNAKVFFDRAIVYFAMGKDDLALEDIEKAISFDPTIVQRLGPKLQIREEIKEKPGKVQIRHKHGVVNIKNGSLQIKSKAKDS